MAKYTAFGLERVADVIGTKSELTWRSPQVWAGLGQIGPTPNDNGCWSFRKSDLQQVESVVAQLESAMIEYGFPFLDAIREDEDVVRIMRGTIFVHHHPDLIRQFIESYHAVNPTFSIERSHPKLLRGADWRMDVSNEKA